MEEHWLDRVHKTMLSTIELVQKGENEQAFADLDNILAVALRDNQRACFKTLCNHAAAMAYTVGDRHREVKYRKQALPFTKDRQFALYHIAQLFLLDGQIGFAQQYASEAYRLTKADESQGGRDLAAAILKTWPSIVTDR
jgi:hypothetical protein